MLELSKRDSEHKYNWNVHPTTRNCLDDINFRLGSMNAKNVLMSSLIL
jgi:hypothetical protein